MIVEETIDRLMEMKFKGMAEGFRKALEEPAWRKLSFPERFALVVEEEYRIRKERSRERRMKQAQFRHHARLEDVRVSKDRGLPKEMFIDLDRGRWLDQHRPVLITGPTGVGKTYLSCALGEKACRGGYRVQYWRVSRLLEELRITHLEGMWTKTLKQLARFDVLILDDFGVWDLTESGRRDILEIIEDRTGIKSTIVSTQQPVDTWHEMLGGDNIADSILDRLIHSAIKIKLDGPSGRKEEPEKKGA